MKYCGYKIERSKLRYGFSVPCSLSRYATNFPVYRTVLHPWCITRPGSGVTNCYAGTLTYAKFWVCMDIMRGTS